ncbi:MAG: bis(5'-nucleosyl)-tetraphosphatase (symmetrical) YqeK [Trueperaceae bacterium]
MRRSEGSMVNEAIFQGDGPCARSSVAPWCRRVRDRVAPDRWRHIVRVADLAEAIARANGFREDEVRATALAGILHDAARDLPDERLLELAPPRTDAERGHPMMLHGRAARVLAEGWGVHDPRVLAAIEGHVAGVRPGDRVGMAVYVADVSEPGRGVNHDVRELAFRDLGAAYRKAVRSKVDYLRSCGKSVHPTTLEVHDSLAPDPS